jgi:hypothetical protein
MFWPFISFLMSPGTMKYWRLFDHHSCSRNHSFHIYSHDVHRSLLLVMVPIEPVDGQSLFIPVTPLGLAFTQDFPFLMRSHCQQQHQKSQDSFGGQYFILSLPPWCHVGCKTRHQQLSHHSAYDKIWKISNQISKKKEVKNWYDEGSSSIYKI